MEERNILYELPDRDQNKVMYLVPQFPVVYESKVKHHNRVNLQHFTTELYQHFINGMDND